jgi:hypothetical protein
MSNKEDGYPIRLINLSQLQGPGDLSSALAEDANPTVYANRRSW